MLFFETKFFWLFFAFLIFYFSVGKKYRPIVIIVTSYIFYGTWDWRFLSLLIASTSVDYFSGLRIENSKNEHVRKRWLLTSIIFNIGLLGIFKYFDFFASEIQSLFGVSGENYLLLNVILPAGISFYTFQTLGYVIDVYRRQQKAETSYWNFAAFVSFFPQLIAGPIERAHVLLEQIKNPLPPKLSNFYLGTRLFLFGMAKKIVIADNLAKFVDPAFADPAAQDPVTLLLAAYCFSFQIYCDFSGYTDMARGVAKIIGIDLSINFNFPYFAQSIRSFWQRWHITLYSWFRDYIYRPLGGSRVSSGQTIRNILIIFAISGLWHGAGWQFIVWGLIHGTYICIERALEETIVGRFFRHLPAFVKCIMIFHFVTFAWIFFRSPDLSSALAYLNGIGGIFTQDWTISWITVPLEYATYTLPAIGQSTAMPFYFAALLVLVAPLVVCEYFAKSRPVGFDRTWPVDARVILYATLALVMFWFNAEGNPAFIYFQF
ncbi:MAG: MBOAT family protein [Minwuia sp.]|nr:MBOAT family protein [Minwuia sp.]